MAIITKLLRKDTVFEWTSAREAVRQEIITILTSGPVLQIFDPSLQTEIHTDASSVGLGGVLLQTKEGVVKPVAYFGRQTTECESRYHSYDLETLAVVEAIEHFRVYLYGRHFTIYTDCNSVRATALKKDLHPRVARWWMRLQDYDFDIQYRPGTKMAHVDYISRNPVPSAKVLPVKEAKELTLKQHQQQDPLYEQLQAGKVNDEYEIAHEMIVTKAAPTKYWVPPSARLMTMSKYHDGAAHVGKEKGLAKMKEELYWKGMGQCFKKYVQNCRACALGKTHTGRKRGIWQKSCIPEAVNEVWHVDHAGPLPKSRGNTQILVVIDSFSKNCLLLPVGRKTTSEAIRVLEMAFQNLGTPKLIVADRGTAFVSADFTQFLATSQVELRLIPTGMPRENGQVERLMRHIFNLLRASLNEKNEKAWTTELPIIEEVINNTVQSSTGHTPNVLMTGQLKRLTSTSGLLRDAPQLSREYEPDVEEVRLRMAALNSRRKAIFNKVRSSIVPFEKGAKVVLQDTQLARGGKLGRPYRGPVEIVCVLPNERYVVKLKGSRTTTVAHEQLRAWPIDRQL